MTYLALAWKFAKSPLGRYIILAAVVLAAAGYVAHRLIARGKQQGKEEQAQSVQQDVEAQHQLAQADAAAQIAEANRKRAQAEKDAAAFQLEAASYKARAAQVEQQISGTRSRVAAIPATQVHQYNVQTLGLPDDGSPVYGVAQEREIAERITKAPLLEEQVAALKAQAAKQEQYIGAVAQKVEAILEADKARQAYTDRLEGWYTQLYNLHPPQKRSWRCAWLCKKDNKLGLPSPAEAKVQKP
jgi:hypothetical protein